MQTFKTAEEIRKAKAFNEKQKENAKRAQEREEAQRINQKYVALKKAYDKREGKKEPKVYVKYAEVRLTPELEASLKKIEEQKVKTPSQVWDPATKSWIKIQK